MSRHQTQANGTTGNGGAGGDCTVSSPPIQVHHHYHSEHLHYPLTQNFDTKRLEDLLEANLDTELLNHHLLERILDQMSATTDRLAREVAETRAGVESTVALLARIADYIREHADDAGAIERFADDLDGAQGALAAAVAAVPAFGSTGGAVGAAETPGAPGTSLGTPGTPGNVQPATEPVIASESPGTPSSPGEPGEGL